MKKIAITGSLSTGKSIVLNTFKKLGAYTLSADQIVHELLSQNRALIQKVISLLGDGIITKGSIDRKKVAEIVFRSESLLKKLEELVHPLVREEIEKEYKKAKTEGFPLFVVEIPLLFEVGDDKNYDATILVTSKKELALSRFMQKTGLSQEDFDLRTKRQMTQEEKKKRAHYILENNGSEEDLERASSHLFMKIS